MKRRSFLTATISAGALVSTRASMHTNMLHAPPAAPVVISTWNFGVKANVESLRILS